MRLFLGAAALLVTGGSGTRAADAAETARQSERPNILWLIAEDFGQHLGCYGTKEVNTPNLDALASKGVRYTRYFTTAPVCSPSRSAFNTGMYQTTIGAHQHRTPDKKPLPEGVDTLSNWMRKGNYYTSNVRTFPSELGIKGQGKTDWNFLSEGKPFDGDDWSELKSHQPFYAQVNFQETHRTFHAPPHADPAKVEVPPYYPDHPVVREDWAKYLDAATELDRKVGLILGQLKNDGLADNTIVIFMGDNGQAHVRGKQFCYDSGLLVPFILYWPAQLNPPGGYKPGSVDDRLLMAIDLTAQTLSWAGQPIPPKMQGKPFLGPDAGPDRKYVFGARDRCDETVFRFRTVRDDRYRYIRNYTPDRPMLLENNYKETQYPAWNLIKELGQQGKLTTPAQKLIAAPTMPAEELYDEQADPYETVNLATSTDPAHQQALARLRGVLDEWVASTHDLGEKDDTTVKVLKPSKEEKAEKAKKKGKKNK